MIERPVTIRRGSPRRGFTLIEMLLAIVILVAVLSLGTQLIRLMVLLWEQTARYSDQANRIDSAVFRMRADAWGATEIKLIDPRSIELATAGKDKITWQIQPDGSLHRSDSTGERQWESVADRWRFDRDELSVMVIDAKSPDQVPLRLPSQILLAARTQP